MKLNTQTKRMFTEANQVSTGKTYMSSAHSSTLRKIHKNKECNEEKNENDNIELKYE